MDKAETLKLYKQGLKAWNCWAEEMLAQRTKLTETGELATEIDGNGKLLGKNPATQNWLIAAISNFSEHHFSQADFTDFLFPGDTSFNRAQFPYYVRFNRTRFIGQTEFEEVVFPGTAEFNKAQFIGTAGFTKARFISTALFNNAEFFSNAIFQKVEFDSAEFQETIFLSKGYFREATFAKRAMFTKATFVGIAEFYQATFKGVPVFYKAKLIDEAKFRRVTFENHVAFNKATFTGKASFEEAKCSGNVLFREVTFKEDVIFNQANFESYTSFQNAVFQKDASFVAIRCQSFFTLENATFFWVPDFAQAIFAEALRLDNSHFKSTSISEQKLVSVNLKEGAPARWRALKRLAVQGHDHERELNFLAEEIKSLRGVQDWLVPNPLSLRKGSPICWPGGGRYWAGLLYQWFSDFGRSAGRPFFVWIAMTITFTFYFYDLSLHSDLDLNKPISLTCSDNPFVDALYISLHNGLVISGLSRTEKITQSYACLYGKEGNDPIMPTAVVLAGLGQTILSAALIFLFLLALRNYFRIK